VTERPARRSPAQGGALLGNRAGIEVPGLSGDAIPDAIPSVHRQIVSSVCFVETQAVEVNNRFWPILLKTPGGDLARNFKSFRKAEI